MNTLEIVILCGFLGSGKTTLLQDHLKDAHTSDTAVIINEVGQIDVDGAVVAAGGTVPSTLLSNGCVCCSLVSDLQTTIEGLQADRLTRDMSPFRRIIVECSGLARPGPIVRSLQRLAIERLDVRVLATFDAVNGARWIDAHDEVAAQAAGAHAVVITKSDLVTDSDRSLTKDLVRALNPLARIIDETDPRLRARHAFDAADRAAPIVSIDLCPANTESPIRLGHRAVKTLLVHLKPDIEWDQIANWLDDLASFCGDRLLRLKGFVQPSDYAGPVLVQSVGTTFSEPRRMPAEAIKHHGLVLIVQGISAIRIREIDDAVTDQVKAVGFKPIWHV